MSPWYTLDGASLGEMGLESGCQKRKKKIKHCGKHKGLLTLYMSYGINKCVLCIMSYFAEDSKHSKCAVLIRV